MNTTPTEHPGIPERSGHESRIITPEEFDPETMLPKTVQKRPRGNNSKHNPKAYLDIVTAFDIETSRLPGTDDAFMYVWQFQVGLDYTVIGRSWDEAMRMFRRIADSFTSDTCSLVVLVHNLSYEFAWLAGLYPFTPDEVFAMDSRKVAKCTMYGGRIEFRCSYIHSNMSLSMYTQQMRVEHQKLDGDVFDYKKLRYPWTELTDYEIRYAQNDVLGLVEAYMAEMKRDGDTLSTIPLTSTGYVRRDCKRAMRMWSRPAIRSMQPDLHLYNLLKGAFRGGDVHANRYYTGSILKNVRSADRSSSYPDVMCNGRFPVSAFRPMRELTIHEAETKLEHNRALLLSLRFIRIRLRDPYYAFPYLSFSKCQARGSYKLDNGRVLCAEYLETIITDVDWQIIREVYTWDSLEVTDGMHASYGKLPKPLVLATQEYYRKKTELKGVEGQEDYYTKSKNRLNSIYGMMVESPIRQTINFLREDPRRFVEAGEDINALLIRNYSRAWNAYQFGVWITAQARYRLYEAIQIAGDNAIYCDTDSVKYIGVVSFKKYNTQRVRDSKRSGSYATDPQGVTHYMGVMEQEQTYSRFVTHGAKKYAYEYEDGKPHITISGVNKKRGAQELEHAGGLEALQPGFVFTAAGGTESVYNDYSDYDVEVDGHTLHISPNICIRDSTYTLTYADDYDRLLKDPDILKHIKETFGDYT